MLLTSSILMYITGLSVTAGYHRLYSHTSYKIHPVLEGILLFFATMATQGSALRWSFEHRLHHAFVDTDRDPYSIKKGFWYAHFFWLIEKPKEIDPKVVADLMKNPLIRFQHRFYPILMLLTNLLATLVVGWCFGSYLDAFLFSWFTRLFFLHHFTWFINSLAHTWGARTYCQELSAVDNYVIALLTFGEGYHNYHHTFANDYRNGIRWYHFDPTKWLIWTFSKLRLAYNLRKNPRYFIEEKLLLETKQILLEKARHLPDDHKATWVEQITKLSDNVLVKLREVKQLKNHYLGLKEKEEKKESLQEARSNMKIMKKEFKREYGYWMVLTRRVMKLPASLGNAQATPTIVAD
ncbi:MAG: acyl-CoA desaturase [Chlamydiales bacterium]